MYYFLSIRSKEYQKNNSQIFFTRIMVNAGEVNLMLICYNKTDALKELKIPSKHSQGMR